MGTLIIILFVFFVGLTACTSPEATRMWGGGPGADVGNRSQIVLMHEGSRPYAGTSQIIPSKHAPLESARQADLLSWKQ